jgi:hypothetical protein
MQSHLLLSIEAEEGAEDEVSASVPASSSGRRMVSVNASLLEMHCEALRWSLPLLTAALPAELLVWLLGAALIEAKIIVIGR